MIVLLFQVVFYARIAKEQGDFDFHAVADGICRKMLRRHPHVFATKQDLNEEQLRRQWTAIKENEKTNRNRKALIRVVITASSPLVISRLLST